jgi:hypothetical protein
MSWQTDSAEIGTAASVAPIAEKRQRSQNIRFVGGVVALATREPAFD